MHNGRNQSLAPLMERIEVADVYKEATMDDTASDAAREAQK
jgi:hypothetical protein